MRLSRRAARYRAAKAAALTGMSVLAAALAGTSAQAAALTGTSAQAAALTGTSVQAAALTGTSVQAAASPAVAADWPAFLNGPLHSSYAQTQTAITPRSVPALVRRWHLRGGFLASPTVAAGAVFIGTDAGFFYKLDESTGRVLAKRFIGFQPRKTCRANGVVDTATVAVDPRDHQDTVYVAGPDGYLYALRASDLALTWKSVIAIPARRTSNYFDWSSPTVANGRVYIGVSSHCDVPLVRGGVISYDQVTGRKSAEFFTVRRGASGGSVWSSVAVDSRGDVYVSTGNGPTAEPRLGYSESIVKLNPRTLAPLGYFTIPSSQVSYDADFGGSPTIFGRYVGACNKNGIYYAVRRSTMTLAWERRIGAASRSGTYAQCSAAAVYDGRHLYLGGTAVTIRGRTFRGSVQERSTDGRLLWAVGLPDGVIGSPSADAGGVVAVGTFDNAAPNGVYLVSARTGRIVRRLISGSDDFAQSVFAGGWLFTANGYGLDAWGTGSAT
jgi:outer membrane protein assembly factor BamB